MPSLFHDLPQDPETVAAVRRLCDERGRPAVCDQSLCQRKRRCLMLWRADPDDARRVMPPCLSAEANALCWAVAEAETRYVDLKTAIAIIRKLPDPDAAAERNGYEPEDDAFDPENEADWAA